MSIRINDTIQLDDWELTETFTRASGPGGQNVNKVETAVVLRYLFFALRVGSLLAHPPTTSAHLT